MTDSTNTPVKDQAARLAQWSQEQWEAQGLRPEALITRNLQECEKKLKRPPEQLIQEALAPLAKALAPADSKGAATSVNAAPVVSAFAALERILGVPDECRDNNLSSPEPSVRLAPAASRKPIWPTMKLLLPGSGSVPN